MTDHNRHNLEFFNGYGGFARDGREYHIHLNGDAQPPAPWINVISNPQFGFTVSHMGGGFTWAGNSRENKLTPWSNDPVMDPPGEAVLIRDEDSGRVIHPLPLGRPLRGDYEVRHGFGYSSFHHERAGLKQDLRLFAAVEDPVKLWELALNNTGEGVRRLSVTLYVEWVLGTDRSATQPYLVTGFDKDNACLTARNVYSQLYPGQQAFLFASEPLSGYTGDRQEVLGRGGSLTYPRGLEDGLRQSVGVGFDACGALQVRVDLQPGERRELVFGMGFAPSQDIPALCRHYRGLEDAREAFHQVERHWEDLLGAVQVQTPDRRMDILLNGWLMYQNIACRLYARTAFYQNGGAFGFRDQLQDSMALIHTAPQVFRAQLLKAAARQFTEGDVQHWWHPPTGVGVRTRITDDLHWLPFTTAFYIKATGDWQVLGEEVPFITGPQLEEGQHDAMFLPDITQEKANLYQHCKRAIARARYSERGLPLMGGGDWNDGMDHVGIKGKGESVWLGWFLYAVLEAFIPLAQHMGEEGYANSLRLGMARLQESLEAHAWDGAWYLRAFHDEGGQLGSHNNLECRIDSISQSWSILSGAAGQERARQAFHSALEHLVLFEEGVSLLLTPPFDSSPQYPGYIMDYQPGIRENGGQYTHAAIWLAISAVRLGEYEQARRLFDILNPIWHSRDRAQADLYEKEPYVMAADLYYQAPRTGRGGWSWYTGSAGWMYQGLLFHFLGLQKEGDTLLIAPGVPAEFGDYTIRYRYGASLYSIHVRCNPRGPAPREQARIRLRDDGQEHEITIENCF
ncbi:MAG: hypothetical protein GXY84_01625 [Clostridiales bacterium]|nr:hypothetical protein [Clostridiales bacterium]